MGIRGINALKRENEMKAIKITTQNQQMLASRHAIDTDDIDTQLPIWFWYITDFGNEETFEVVTEELFTATFNNEYRIKNGFVAIARK